MLLEGLDERERSSKYVAVVLEYMDPNDDSQRAGLFQCWS